MQTELPQFPESYWLNSDNLPAFSTLSEDEQTDVVIAGAGITGISLAYLLSKRGMRVVLLEAGKVLSGTTGHTTAKLTCQHHAIYDELIAHYGEEKARQYYEMNNEGFQWVKKMIIDHEIDCDFQEDDAWIYATSVDQMPVLEKEHLAYEKLGIPGKLVKESSLPFQIRLGLIMDKQAYFNPVRFLVKLLELACNQGVKVYERTTALSIENGNPPYVMTGEGHKVFAKHIVSCSHFPFHGSYFNSFRMYAERSYAVCFKPKQSYPGGMYINMEQPTRSLRPVHINGELHVIAGGENHPTGQGICTFQHYEALQQFAEETFGVETIPYRWSAQDLITLDKLPMIGASNAKDPFYVATGYKKWGMTTGAAAALLLEKAILGEQSPYAELCTPARFHADPTVKTFLTYSGNIVKHLLKGKLLVSSELEPEELGNNEGSVVLMDGKRAGAYRDEAGNLFVVDTTCTHMGCEVEWNSGERTWDCPCHGSRFSYTGEVVNGPAKKPLTRFQ